MDDKARAIMEEAIKADDSTASNIKPIIVVSDFMESDIYYVTWDSTSLPQRESFYYVLLGKDGVVHTYDDGVVAIDKLKDRLDSQRTLWQRLREFSLIEVMAALIALCVTVVFIILSIVGINKPEALTKEFLGIFGIIIGYYFGKNVPSK